MALTGGTGLQPHPIKGAALNENYLSFTNGTNDFAQQYLPELYEQEVERYGNRTIGGFLRMVGAEMPMSSDQVVWSEQNRLHIGYKDAVVTSNTRITITLAPAEKLALRDKDLIVVQGAAGELVCEVTDVDDASGLTPYVDVKPYEAAGLTTGGGSIFTNADKISLFVFGSEHAKGSDSSQATLKPSFTKFDNKPMIIRDEFKVNGSDTAQIGWVEVATEDGTSGYLWYMKAESETRLRFEDYLEMTMVEAVKKNTDGTATEEGSQGLFSAIKERGHVMAGFSSATGGGTGAVADFDEILKGLDKEGAIEENMLFVNRSLALDIDDMLAEVNGSPAGFAAGGIGASFGLFNNEAEMALNLGFSGFRRGSYDFYKSDWKYLNDASTRGVLGLNPNSPLANLTGTVEGVLVPAGTSTVYDQSLGSNIRRPFLHVRYRASEADDRRMKSWVTGSVGGAYTSGLDAMEVHFLSERCLCVQGANNFVLFTS